MGTGSPSVAEEDHIIDQQTNLVGHMTDNLLHDEFVSGGTKSDCHDGARSQARSSVLH